MIINFSVQNFGSIKNKQTLSFDADKSDKLSDYYVMSVNGHRLLKLGLIFGANASGKTTILKALDFLRQLVLHPIDNKTSELNFEPFLFDEITANENSIIELDFVDKIRYQYYIEFNKSAIVSEELYRYVGSSKRKSKVFSRTTDVDMQFAKIKIGDGIKIEKKQVAALETNTLWNNTVLGGYLKTNIQFEDLQNTVNWFSNYLRPTIMPNSNLEEFVTDGLHDNNIDKEAVVDLLKRADLYISDIRTKKIETEIPDELIDILKNIQAQKSDKAQIDKKVSVSLVEFEHTVNDKKFYLLLEQESAGTRRYYSFAGLLVNIISESGVLLIDEMESSLHPDLFEHFLLMFLKNSNGSQIIATTHFREFLNDRSLYRDDVIWFTNKDNDCATELYSLADFDSSVIRDSSNILNAYKSGRLGATPNTGDLYIEKD
ncbi:MAG: ATP-binding protein [Proteiniphilum sp.]|nr:ATP-binding protein [Proteiniphilum sp.]